MELYRNPAAAEAHLREAQRCCKDGKAFLDDVGIGGLTDLETTLSYIYRMLKDFKQAQYWVDVAMALAVNSASLAEIGLVYAEAAEIQYALGDRDAAIKKYKLAMAMFRRSGNTDWLNKIKKHLKLLKSDLQDLSPLKLW